MTTPAPPDGSWLDNPRTVKSVLMFLISKLSPSDLEEMDKALIGEGITMATDSRLDAAPDLKRDFLKYAPRDRKALRGALAGAGGRMTMDEICRADPMHGKSLEERFPGLFPNNGRLK